MSSIWQAPMPLGMAMKDWLLSVWNIYTILLSPSLHALCHLWTQAEKTIHLYSMWCSIMAAVSSDWLMSVLPYTVFISCCFCVCSTTWQHAVGSSLSLSLSRRVCVYNMTPWSRANLSTLCSLSVACARCCRSSLVSGEKKIANWDHWHSKHRSYSMY